MLSQKQLHVAKRDLRLVLIVLGLSIVRLAVPVGVPGLALFFHVVGGIHSPLRHNVLRIARVHSLSDIIKLVAPRTGRSGAG